MNLNSATNEDQRYVGALKMPSLNDPHAIHPKKHDTTFAKMFACRDVIYDHHWEVGNIVKSGLKGAALGIVYAAGFGLLGKTIPSVALKKMFRFIRNQNFGTISILRDLVAPYALTGFGLGSTYYLYQYAFFSNRSNQYLADVVSNGLFFQAASAVVINPSVHIYGLVAGIFIGTVKYAYFNGNSGQTKEAIGSYTTYGDLTPEERQKQEYKDYIQYLGSYHKIRSGQLVEL